MACPTPALRKASKLFIELLVSQRYAALSSSSPYLEAACQRFNQSRSVTITWQARVHQKRIFLDGTSIAGWSEPCPDFPETCHGKRNINAEVREIGIGSNGCLITTELGTASIFAVLVFTTRV